MKLIYHLRSCKELKAKSAEYDKLAVKTISKATIRKGEEILATLGKIVGKLSDTPSATASAGSPEATINNELESDLAKLTSSYYSYVPHLFETGESVMLLDSRERIQKELDMLGSLEGIRMSAILAKDINLRDNGHDNRLSEHFKILSLKNIDVGMLLVTFKRSLA